MWDTVQTSTGITCRTTCRASAAVTRMHTFLSCGDDCDCSPALLPGDRRARRLTDRQGSIITLIARRSSIAR